MTVVRFAPSPTGFLHIGGARTCLFNWLYARNTGGKFILRIEDTDINRSQSQYYDEIVSSLQWLGLSWDEEYRQSQRFDLYRRQAEALVAEGKAYRDGTAILYKLPEQTPVRFFDIVHGEITIDSEQLKDQVLIKSDGSPAYNFCCVVDDAAMGVTHIIRGDDHIANTPKQLLLYAAIGAAAPKFAHIPMILGEDRSRLSKRHGATAISDYRRQGFLPAALVNYLALLGWNPGTNREFFSLPQLVKEFSLKRVGKTAAVFDRERLGWLNGQYIKQTDDTELTELVLPYVCPLSPDHEIDKSWLQGLVRLYKTRFQTLADFSRLTEFFFRPELRYDDAAAAELLNRPQLAELFAALSDAFAQAPVFDAAALERIVRDFVAARQLKAADIIHPLRVAVTGGSVSPGIFDVLQFLGQETTVARLRGVMNTLQARQQLFDKCEEL